MKEGDVWESSKVTDGVGDCANGIKQDILYWKRARRLSDSLRIDDGCESCDDNGIYIYNLAITPEYRRRGLADYLIKQILKIKCPYFYLWIDYDNIQAMKLYEKNGFIIDKQYDSKIIYVHTSSYTLTCVHICSEIN